MEYKKILEMLNSIPLDDWVKESDIRNGKVSKNGVSLSFPFVIEEKLRYINRDYTLEICTPNGTGTISCISIDVPEPFWPLGNKDRRKVYEKLEEIQAHIKKYKLGEKRTQNKETFDIAYKRFCG